ncbi:MAG: NAD-dependent epimerase/dehydratase family protein [Rhizobiaceae bacterium]
MTKKFLVTGGSGFIGSALVIGLLNAGYAVRVFDNNSRGNLRRLESVMDRIEFVEGDIRDPKQVLDAAEGVDSICHLAYLNGTRFFYEQPDRVLEIGVKGMVNVLDACEAHGIDELVLASSSEVYQTAPVTPTGEDVPLIVPDVMNPRYSYGGGKIISELMAINYGRERIKRVLVFRPHNVFGPDMGFEHVIPEFAMRLVRSSSLEQPIPFNIQGTGEETRAFIYIDDFTDGLIRVIEKGEHLNVYHIGTMEEEPVRRIAELSAMALGLDIEIVPGKLTAGSTPRRCADNAKLRGLGFEQKVSLADGIAKTVTWYRDNQQLWPQTS